MSRLFVHGIGHFHPDSVIDNRFLEDLDIGTSDTWILERVGIRERRSVLPLDYIRRTKNADVRAGFEASLYSNAETGRRAGEAALGRAGIRPSDIGMVMSGASTTETSAPAEACRIAAALDIDAPAIDLTSACSSFGAQMHTLAHQTQLPPFVLVVNADNSTRVVDYADRSSAVLWGDGTTATVVSTQEPSPVRIAHTTLASKPAEWNRVTIPRSGHFRQDGSHVQRFAIRTTVACLENLLPAARAAIGASGGRLRFIGHQANLLMLESAARHAHVEPEEMWHNVADYGNTGAASAPSVLSQRWDELQRGDRILMVLVGSGLTWSSISFEVDA